MNGDNGAFHQEKLSNLLDLELKRKVGKNKLVTLPETNSKQKMHLKMVACNRNLTFFRRSIFRCELFVLGR